MHKNRVAVDNRILQPVGVVVVEEEEEEEMEGQKELHLNQVKKVGDKVLHERVIILMRMMTKHNNEEKEVLKLNSLNGKEVNAGTMLVVIFERQQLKQVLRLLLAALIRHHLHHHLLQKMETGS
jgi:hypothetical protein